PPPAAALAQRVEHGGRRRLAGVRRRAEAPGVDQRPHRGVIGAVRGGGQPQGMVQYEQAVVGQRLPAGRRAVVARQVGAVVPGTHLRDHLVQRLLDGGARGRRGHPRRQRQAGRPGGAHGRARQRGRRHDGGRKQRPLGRRPGGRGGGRGRSGGGRVVRRGGGHGGGGAAARLCGGDGPRGDYGCSTSSVATYDSRRLLAC